MTFFNALIKHPNHLEFFVYEREKFTALGKTKLYTKMILDYWRHSMSEEYSLIPVVYELADDDDNIEKKFWQIKLLWPNNDEELRDFLKEFGLKMFVNKYLLWKYGIIEKLDGNELSCAEYEDSWACPQLASIAHQRKIIVLDDYLLKTPETMHSRLLCYRTTEVELKPFWYDGYHSYQEGTRKHNTAANSEIENLIVPRIDRSSEVNAFASSGSFNKCISSRESSEVDIYFFFIIKY